MKAKILILLTAITLVSSCGTVPAKIMLPLPPEPNYPKIDKSALICLSDETFKKLVIRDVMKTRRIKTLENIILSTH